MRLMKSLLIVALALSSVLLGAEADRPGSVPDTDMLLDVDLNGVRQKILIESTNLRRPILLWLHGGPGASEMFISHYCLKGLLPYFTIVHWDQRGTALSYDERMSAADVSFDKILDDAVRLTEFLRSIYRQDKIFLLGHSFGSVLGIHLADRHPEYYAAYIGMGQVVDDGRSRGITYDWLKTEIAKRNGAEGLARLTDPDNIPRELIEKYRGIYFKGKTLFDVIKESPRYYPGYLDLYRTSMNFVRDALAKSQSVSEKNIFRDIRKLDVPVYFFEGRHDRVAACAPELVVEYCGLLEAPRKEIVWFEESAHHPNIDEPERFQRAIIDKIYKEKAGRGALRRPAAAPLPVRRATSDQLLDTYKPALVKIFELQTRLKPLHPALAKVYPVAVVENGLFHVFEPDPAQRTYRLALTAPDTMSVPPGVRAAMPLGFWGNRMACVVTGEVFDEPDGYVTILHEFVHCSQWEGCERKLKDGLSIHRAAMSKNDFMWELQYPFPYADPEFRRIYKSLIATWDNDFEEEADALRAELKASLSPQDWEYLTWQEWKEGLARWLENRIRAVLGFAENVGGEPPPFDRVTFYRGGDGLIRYLERREPGIAADIEKLYRAISQKGLAPGRIHGI
ncbi:MAG: alpha/beta hydrolase [Candidatus Aminicenantes bacterium]|nr:alpha/beta hydrolase [Candidatus Aminicenantes bacterium]